MYAIVINQEGYKVEFVALNADDTPQFYELKEGESLIGADWQIANSMNKPKWDGEKWIDTDPLPPIEPQEPILDQKVILLAELETYKHDYILFIDYDNHKQCTLPDDIIKIQGSERLLKENVFEAIEWKYPDAYVTVTDADYFWQMQLAITIATNKTYQTEKLLREEINALSEEALLTYDLHTRFDEVYRGLDHAQI